MKSQDLFLPRSNKIKEKNPYNHEGKGNFAFLKNSVLQCFITLVLFENKIIEENSSKHCNSKLL